MTADLRNQPGPEFRPRLERIIQHGGNRTLCVIGQNPSKAGPNPSDPDDPTIHRLLVIGWNLGYHRLLMTNLSPKIETDSAAFFRWLYSDDFLSWRVPHLNWAYSLILAAARESELVVAAWGRGFATYEDGDGWPHLVREWLQRDGIALHVFGLNRDGTPRHPMARGLSRLRDDVVPVPWETT